MQSKESKYTTPWHWWLITVVGISFVIMGIILQEKYTLHYLTYLGIIVFGLGMSVIGALFVKISTNDLENIVYKWWRKKYIEVFTESRQQEAEKYTKENENIKDKLLLLSVSASNAIQELKNNSTLFKKLAKDAKMKFIILDPSSDSAAERAKADNPDNPNSGKNEMKEEFIKIESLLDLLNKNHIGGSLEIRATKSPVNTTIYCHQDRLVFGPYFPDGRGDTHGSYSICPKYNQNLFGEYNDIFYEQWGKSKTILDRNGGKYCLTPEYVRIKSQL